MTTARQSRNADAPPASPFEELLDASTGDQNASPPEQGAPAAAAPAAQPTSEGNVAQPTPAVDAAAAIEAGSALPIVPDAPHLIVVAAQAALNTGVTADVSAGKTGDTDNKANKTKPDAAEATIDASAVIDAPTTEAVPVLPAPAAAAAPPPVPAAAAVVTDARAVAAKDPVAVTTDAPILVPVVRLTAPKAAATRTAPAAGAAETDVAPPVEGPTQTDRPAAAVVPATAALVDLQPNNDPAPTVQQHATTDAPAEPAHDRAVPTRPAVDPSQLLALSQPARPADSTPPADAAANPAAAAPAVAAAVPIAGVAIAIVGKALEGKNRFEIRLDPPELGRIDVRLDVASDGRITTHVVADRSDTLTLLRNDAPALQRAFDDAGLRTSDNGLQFSLRDQSANQQQQQESRGPVLNLVAEDSSLPAIEPAALNYSRLGLRAGGVDIRV